MLNKFRKTRFTSLFMVLTMLFISFQPVANAAMVGTADIVAQQQSQIDRDTLLKSLDRAEVQAALESQGVDMDMAKKRVAAMTDAEVSELNAKLDDLPAASGILDTILLILLILLITDLVGVTDVYPFIR